jgi:hypothetical protein
MQRAAKVSEEPTSTDAARRINGHKLHIRAIRPNLPKESWCISAVANVSLNQPLTVLLFTQGVGLPGRGQNGCIQMRLVFSLQC